MGRKLKVFFLMTLLVGLSLGVFFNAASTAKAYPEMSPDGVTCTPCHEEGFGGNQQPTQDPVQDPVQDNVQNPLQGTAVDKNVEKATEGLGNNVYYIIGALVAVALIAALLLRKRR